ncbi:unnamed protein product [Leuciscus chuanchicus]
MGQTPQQGQQLNDNHPTLLTAPISPRCPGRRLPLQPLTPQESHTAALPTGQGALFPLEAITQNPSSVWFSTRDLSSFSTSSCQYGIRSPPEMGQVNPYTPPQVPARNSTLSSPTLRHRDVRGAQMGHHYGTTQCKGMLGWLRTQTHLPWETLRSALALHSLGPGQDV